MSRAASYIVKRPLLTEKGTKLKEQGGAPFGTFTEETLKPQVLFEVALDANKIEIKRAVQTLFHVKVREVRTMTLPGKIKRMGRYAGARPDWKRAVVTLEAGQTIALFEEV